jgi:hypothetical protein
MIMLLAGVIALCLLWSAYWLVLSYQAQELAARAEADLNSQGVTLACETRSWGGYPFRIEFGCAKPGLTISSPQGEWRITSGNLALIMQAYDYRHAIALLDGPTNVSLNGGTALAATHNRAAASLVREGNTKARLAIEVPKLAISGQGTSDLVIVNASLDGENPARLSASARNLAVTEPEAIALDQAAFELEAPAAMVLAADPAAQARASGAPVKLSHFEAEKGGLKVNATGAANLKPDGTPEGEIVTTISDLERLIVEVRKSVPMTDEDANAMRTMLGLLGGGQTNTRIALKAKDGALYWGPFRIAPLPKLGP